MSMSCDTSILLIMRQKMRIRLIKRSKKHNHLVFELPFNVALCISSRNRHFHFLHMRSPNSMLKESIWHQNIFSATL
jgi:hypothetical protein